MGARPASRATPPIPRRASAQSVTMGPQAAPNPSAPNPSSAKPASNPLTSGDPVKAPSPILIVGSMAFDDLQLPTVTATDVVGGSATYSAFAASAFAPVRVVAVVGDDFPAATLEEMRARGIDTD